MTDMTDYEAPYNVEAERAVLGSLLIDPDGYRKIDGVLVAEDFYRHSHKQLFGAISALGERNIPPDFITVCEELERRGTLDEAGGEPYVSGLANEIPSPFHVEHYGDIVRRVSVKRQIGDVGRELVRRSGDARSAVEEILDGAERLIFGIARQTEARDYLSVRDLLADYSESMHERRDTDTLRGIPTGYPTLDALTGGYQRSDLIIVAARTGIGKTTYLVNACRNAARDNHIPVGLLTLELSAEQVIGRLLSLEAKVDSRLLRDADLTDEGWVKVGRAVGELSEYPIYVDDSPALSVMQLRGKARRMQAERNVGLICVDYLQLLRAERTDNRVQEISDITRALKGLARELNIPVMAGAQLSRAVEQRESGRPRLSDLRESGSIEQDADLVLFLYEDRSDGLDIACELAKHRNGPNGKFKLRFERAIGRFEEIRSSRPEPEAGPY